MNQMGNNKKIFLSKKPFQHDYAIIEAQKYAGKMTQKLARKIGVQTTREKVLEKARSGFINDSDILRLLSVKEKMYPVYDYKKLNERTVPPTEEELEDEGIIALKQWKQAIKENQAKQQD